MSTYNYLLSILSIIFGITLIVLSIGNLIVRIVVALGGVVLINYGFQQRGAAPLQWQAYSMYSSFSKKRFWTK
jgi:hypothetical protein